MSHLTRYVPDRGGRTKFHDDYSISGNIAQDDTKLPNSIIRCNAIALTFLAL